MESRKRKIRDGKEFNKFFPPPSEEDTTVKKEADVEDTMALIKRTVPKTTWQTQKIAKELKGRTLEETCSNIWHFVYEHIQYKRDEDGVEQVRSPRRTWWERDSGVDCDCYTEFISSILLNFNVPHKLRITKYPKHPPEIPRWQHVYPIVPRSGRLNNALHRDDYIVLDCVKDEFDSEQPFLECKDYDMRLDYLDGIDQDEIEEGMQDVRQIGTGYTEPDNVDLADLASVSEDEEIGNLFKKIGKVVKKVADKAGEGIRFLNRYTNPATILLRNGFLLAMKINLMNVAGKLRFAYLTDAQAKAMGMNLDSLKKVRQVKDRAETIYWQAGGKKENFKKAILKGKGNKDKKVSLSGLSGLDNVYADLDEYNIIHNDINDLGALGDPITGTALAAATSAIAAIAGALKQVKGLFNKGGKEEQSFQSETDNAGSAASAEVNIKEGEDQTFFEDEPAQKPPTSSNTTQIQKIYNETAVNTPAPIEPALPVAASIARRNTTDVEPTPQNNEAQVTENKTQGLVQKTTTWVKENPGKTLMIAGAVVGGSFLIIKSLQGNKPKQNGVNGLPSQHKKQPKHRNKNRKPKYKKVKVGRTNLL